MKSHFRVGFGIALLLACNGSFPQVNTPYPAKAIRLVVPFGTGSSTDMLARLVGQKIAESWNQPVVIDNRAGAGGNIATDMVAKAPGDVVDKIRERNTLAGEEVDRISARLAAQGLKVREYRLPHNGSVNCTVAPTGRPSNVCCVPSSLSSFTGSASTPATCL